MLTCKPCLVAALLFLIRSGGDGAPGSPPAGRKLLQHLDPGWNLNQKLEGKERPSHLRWVDFDGTLPADTVSNWNNYTKTMEYVCSTEADGCNAGAYVPSRGPFCFYPFWQSEHRASNFKLLVNRGNLEALRWVDDSFGDVPANAVEGCPSVDIYVGRNQYGLGKVSKDQQAFFVVVDHKEVWFKWYQVLAVRTGPADVTISDVRYNTSEALGRGEDVTLTKTTVKNEGCRGHREEVALEEASEVMHDWELDQKVFSAVRGALRAAPLAFNGTSWVATTNVTRVTWVGRATAGEYVVHTRNIKVQMRPRTTCTVALVGRRLDVRVPFTAWLTRDFGDGQVHRVAVTGVARSRAVVDIQGGVEQCSPLAGASPCQG